MRLSEQDHKGENAMPTLTLRSAWLPAAELHRLLDEYAGDFPGLEVTPPAPAEYRGIDPAMGVALVSGTFSLLVPLAAKIV